MELPSFSPITAGLVIFSLFLAFYLLSQYFHAPIQSIPGPSSQSWLVGNLPDLYRQKNLGDTEFKWMREYGNMVKIKGGFGRDILFAADPKAVQHILGTSGYNYPKSPEFRALINRVTGHGLSWAEGKSTDYSITFQLNFPSSGRQHVDQRKIINPAFSYNSLRVYLPLFQRNIQKTTTKWKDLSAKESRGRFVTDVHMWLARATLDIIGACAFDYDFGATDQEKENELAAMYKNLTADSFLAPGDGMIAMGELPGLVPAWVIDALNRLPDPGLRRLRQCIQTTKNVGKKLVDSQIKAHAAGHEGGKDILSILAKANLSEDPKTAMTEDEVLSQMTTMMFAGHETTANTLAFILYELSQDLDIQNDLRAEIRATRAKAALRGDSELQITDLDSMKLLGAVIKETLRIHPILSRVERMAGRDDVIPLSTPLKTSSGEVITGIPVKRGQRVYVSLAGYNRVESVWGEDAHMWRPTRFLEEIEKTDQAKVGVVSNLASFSGGVRGCVGWRFSMVELNALIAELVENFEFLPPSEKVEIKRAAVSLMFPLVTRDGVNRTELPLTVRAVA